MLLNELADLFNVSVDYLLGRTDNPKMTADGTYDPALLVRESQLRYPARKGVRIPVLGRVAAGVPIEAIEEVIDYEEITPELAASGDFFALAIQGESMAPEIRQGDIVVVRQQCEVENGDIAVVLVNGQDATVKKFFHTGHGIKLVPINPSYDPLFFSAAEIESLPVSIVGKVVELRRSF